MTPDPLSIKAPTPPAVTMRKFGDTPALRQGVFDNALSAAQSIAPVENSRYRLSFSDIGYNKRPQFTLAEQREALLDGRTLAHHLVGTATLTDKATNAPVDTRRLTMAAVPYLSNQGYFVLDGNPMILANQLRLSPGAFTRKTQSGRTELHANLPPGNGVSHRIHIDPDTGVFKVTVGQAEIPALPLMRALGATDDEIKKSWGDILNSTDKATKLFDRNVKASKSHHLDRLYEKFGPAGDPPEDPDAKAAAIRDRFATFKFDPWVTNRTLGKGHQTYTKDAALAMAAKLLAVSRGTAEPDDRDHPAYSIVMGPEHLVAERISRSKPLLTKMLWQATNSGKLGGISPRFLTPSVKALFLKSGLGNLPEGSNALEFVDHGARITKVGEGGIGRSSDSVPMSSRHVSSGQLPFIDLIRTSESESVGVDLRTAFGTRIGSDNRLYAPVETKSGRIVYKNPRDLAESVVAFPEAKNSTDPMVPAIKYGKHAHVSKDDVDYYVPSMEQTFSPLSNLVPIKSASKPHRASMGARMITQSLALKDPESPLVRGGVPGQPGKSFDELYGRHMGAAFARNEAPGIVTKVTPDAITVRYADGTDHDHEIFNQLPSGRKSGYQSYPTVKPGDQVAPGQILATSNFTDSKGHAAYGKNARVGFMPYRGKIYEDASIISQSMADRMTSHHLYRHNVDHSDPELKIGRTAHAAAFPGKYPLETMKTVDDDGIVKIGTTVKSGDPLVLAIKKREGEFGRLSRSAKSGYSDATETWEHDEPGRVVDVRRTKNGPVVLVETHTPTKQGDKLSGLYGNKGVTHIIPDHEMPIDAEGKPLEVILSSLGTISRINQSSIFAAALGKIAAKTGNPYVIHDFQDNQNIGKFVEDELQKHGVNFMETLTDPKNGRPIPNVGVGNMYLMKLSHMSANKAKGRGLGGYDETGQPTRGGEGGSMRSSLGDTSALISYGAHENLKDAHLVRGQSDPNFWSAYMAGFPVKHATVSEPFNRFLTELRASGINPVRDGQKYQLMGLKKSDIDEMTGDREVKNGETLDFSREQRPYPGGLHDPNTFGAIDSKNTWGRVSLHEPMLNPVFEEPTRRLLGLTEKDFRDTIAGTHKLPGGGTGMEGLVEALNRYDVPKELESARRTAAGSRKTARDAANRKIGYLKYMDKNGTKPADWVWDAVPVLPPAFRPVTPGRAGSAAVSADANMVYRELIEANNGIKSLHGKVDDVGPERLNLYDAIRGVTGLGDPITAKNRERGVKGILGKLLGDSAKSSFLQQKLLGTPVDLSGRGQVLPSPDLDLDQIGIPESVAWDIYHPFVVRRLVRGGVPRVEAALHAKDKTEMAKKALIDEMEVRPVLATRYPVLHKFGVMGFKPKLVAGDAILSNNLVNKPLNLDHDGDTFTVNVPLTDEAVKEAYDKLLPSKNLFSPATMRSHLHPNMEYVTGLHVASTADEKNEPIEFPNIAAARAAYKAAKIGLGTRIRIVG